ncbi:MAG: hypothetical protein GX306_13020 [Clostridiales bacterium]|nr:hypothetical protein [Clostridiales bacterium]
MKTTSELIQRIGEFEKAGFTRTEAIEILKIERAIILNNQIKALSDILRARE